VGPPVGLGHDTYNCVRPSPRTVLRIDDACPHSANLPEIREGITGVEEEETWLPLLCNTTLAARIELAEARLGSSR
jgi:hypothetical protein